MSSLSQSSFKKERGKAEAVWWSDESKSDMKTCRAECRAEAPSGLLSALSSEACVSADVGVRWCLWSWQLHIWRGSTLSAERYTQVLEQHVLPFRWLLSQEDDGKLTAAKQTQDCRTGPRTVLRCSPKDFCKTGINICTLFKISEYFLPHCSFDILGNMWKK